MRKAGSQQRLTEVIGDSSSGVDGLNLVEFPLSVLSDRAPDGVKTLEFQETITRYGQQIEQHVTIAGTDKHGLPTSKHHDLIVAAIQLHWERDRWASQRFEFTSYELLKKARWPDVGYYYNLADKALDVYAGTKLYYKNAWFADGEFISTGGFSLIDAHELIRRGKGNTGRRTQQAIREKPSYIHWGIRVFKDFEAKRTKGFDYNLYLELGSSVSRQLYRHLDKWFHYGPEYRHQNAITFAREKIGLSRNHKPSRLITLVQNAAEELESVGYLKPMAKDKRFRRRPDGVYEVCFEQNRKRKITRRVAYPPQENTSPVAKELVSRGMQQKQATHWANKEPEESKQQIEYFDFRTSRGWKPRNAGGYLNTAIETRQEPPERFVSEAEKQEQRKQKEMRDAKCRTESVKADRRVAAGRNKYAERERVVENHLSQLSEEQRQKLVDAAYRANPSKDNRIGRDSEMTRVDVVFRYLKRTSAT